MNSAEHLSKFLHQPDTILDKTDANEEGKEKNSDTDSMSEEEISTAMKGNDTDTGKDQPISFDQNGFLQF